MLEHSNPPTEDSALEGATADAAPAAEPAEAAAVPPPLPELSPAACSARLVELFPAVFSPGAPKPLKLRIQADVQQRAPGIFTRKALSGFLHRHTTSTPYLKALLNSAQRTDLDGLPAGDVASEHREAAATELQRRRNLHDARRAAEREAQRATEREAQRAERAAHDEAQRARAAQDEQRRDRQALLRGFEASTLSRSNFCALKGLSEAELDAALAQGRQERQERQEPLPPFAKPAEPMRTGSRGATDRQANAQTSAAPRRRDAGGARNP